MSDFMPRVGSRRWIAWKLVQVAAKVYDAEYYERLSIKDDDGNLVDEWTIVGDLYGCGVSSHFGPGELKGYTVTWEEFTPDWAESSNA